MINLVLSIYLLTKIYIVRRLLKGFGTVQNRNSESKLVPMFVEYPSQFLRTRSGIIGFEYNSKIFETEWICPTHLGSQAGISS